MDCVSLHSTTLQKLFRKSDDGGYYRGVITHYFDIADDKYRFSPYGRYTKKYRLKSWVMARLREDYSRMYTDILGKNMVSNCLNSSVFDAGVMDFDDDGYPPLSRFELAPFLSINIERVMEAIAYIESHPDTPLTSHTKLYNLIQLYSWMEAYAKYANGMAIPQRYIESTNGRLVGVFDEGIPHIIRKKERLAPASRDPRFQLTTPPCNVAAPVQSRTCT